MNAYFFNLINALAFAQARCVNDVHRHTFNLNGLLHHIARGSCNGRDDGQLCTRQRIEQRTLARIGLTRNDHLDAFTQQRALLRARQYFDQLCLQPIELALCISLLQEINFFFRKIQSGFDQHAQMNQAIAQCVDFFGKIAGQ